MSSILISTFGSGGDLFPLVSIAEQLIRREHQVTFVLPRSLSLYLRGSDFVCRMYGDGSEASVLSDEQIFTKRFGGWASWRETVVRYIAPRLRSDSERLTSIFDEVRPDVVVTSTFATAARIAVRQVGAPHVSTSIYPHMQRFSGRSSTAFARRYVQEVVDVSKVRPDKTAELIDLAWGFPSDTLLLHDRALLPDDWLSPTINISGYPSWDNVAVRAEEPERALAWMTMAPDPVVAVTLGSFLGLAQGRAWGRALEAVTSCGVRAVLVGAHTRWAREHCEGREDVLTTGYLPLSQLLNGTSAVIHHGGLGTTFAALRAGKPAAVMPLAFDQQFNARLLEHVGAGFDSSDRPLADALRLALGSSETLRVQQLASQLVEPGAAARRAADRIISAVVRSDL